MTRKFSQRSRKILRILAGNQCEICAKPLSNSFHADHVYPFSRGGKTTLMNGQALCESCNIKKGASIYMKQSKAPKIKMREWQEKCLKKALDWYSSDDKPENKIFVVNTAPGSGKTALASFLAQALIDKGEIDRVVKVMPRNEIANQSAAQFTRITGRPMTKVTGSDCDIEDFGIDLCCTWSSIQNLKEAFQKVCQKHKVLLVCDEHHHAAKEAAWGKSADNAFRDTKRILILTGTPVRSDGNETVWLHFNEKGDTSQ